MKCNTQADNTKQSTKKMSVDFTTGKLSLSSACASACVCGTLAALRLLTYSKVSKAMVAMLFPHALHQLLQGLLLIVAAILHDAGNQSRNAKILQFADELPGCAQ